MHKALIIAIAAASASAACGQQRAEDGGPTVKRSYPVGSFDRIEVAGPFDVRVRTGGAPGVAARGPEKLIERMVVEVKDDRLIIRPAEDRTGFSWGSNIRGKAIVDVSATALKAAAIAGSGDIKVDTVSGADFEGKVAGSGDLEVDSIRVETLKLGIAGSGDIRARSGEARSADYAIAGSGDIDVSGVAVDTAKVSIAGSGNIKGRASSAAEVKIMGSGDVELTGGARCSVKKVGSGSARCS